MYIEFLFFPNAFRIGLYIIKFGLPFVFDRLYLLLKKAVVRGSEQIHNPRITK